MNTTTPDHRAEIERIRAENARRDREIEPGFYSLDRPANLFLRHGQERALRAALDGAGLLPLAGRRVLEVGCGEGVWLPLFEQFGARREDLAGIELEPDRVARAAARHPGADLRAGDAAALPWAAASFDLVFQATLFTSILDPGLKRAVAGEMLRVVKPAGAVVWLDFRVDNPRNRHVRGIGRREIETLFPRCEITFRRVTLAPPLARLLAPRARPLAAALEALGVFNSHYLATIRRRG